MSNDEWKICLSSLNSLHSDGMILSVRIGGPGGDEVANPAQRATTSNPEAGRYDKPDNASQNATMVKLPDAGNNQTQDTCQKWITHQLPLRCGNRIRLRKWVCSIEHQTLSWVGAALT